MNTFLMIISFLINLVLIMAILLLYMRQNRLLEMEKTQEKRAQELEEMISNYLFEMKDENEIFLQKVVSSTQKDHAKSSYKLEERSNENKINKSGHVKDEEVNTIHVDRLQASKAYQKNVNPATPLITREEKPSFESLSFQEQVQQMNDNGLSVDEIAKKMNCGKTEINLALKFRKKSNS